MLCVLHTLSYSLSILQSLLKLFTIIADNSWNNQAINTITDFLRMVLTFDDGQQLQRLEYVLCGDRYSLGKIALNER